MSTRKRTNPFPRAAVANLMARSEEYLSIDTETSTSVLKELKDRLVSGATTRGFTSLIYGESGSGKTHILRECMQEALKLGAADIIVVETSNTLLIEAFLTQFRAIFDDDRILEYLDDEFALYLVNSVFSELQKEAYLAAKSELSEESISISTFCRRAGLKAQSLREEFWENTDFAVSSYTVSALRALHTEGSSSSEWRSYINAVLGEGVDRERSLEVVRVCLRMMHTGGDKLFFFADEVEKMFSDASDDDRSFIRRFLKLVLEASSAFGHVIIMAGLPDFLDFDNVPDEIQQRFHLTITPQKWGVDDARAFISTVSASSPDAPVRLTGPALSSLIDVTGGVPRLTIRSLYQVYGDAILNRNRKTVGKPDVIRATRGMYEVRSEDSVSAEIETVLKSKNLSYIVPALDDDGAEYSDVVNFRVDISERVQINVVISSSILERRDLKKYEEIAEISTRVEKDITNFFVVNGYIAPAIRNKIRSLGQNRILYVRPSYFDEDFAEAIDNIIDTQKKYQEFSSLEELAKNLHSLSNVVHHSLSRSDRRLEEFEYFLRRNQNQARQQPNLDGQNANLFDLVFAGEIRDEVRKLRRPLELYIELCRELLRSAQGSFGDVGFSRGKRYRNELAGRLDDNSLLIRLVGSSSIVIWVLSDFCEQVATIKLSSVERKRVSQSASAYRYLAKSVSTLLRSQMHNILDLEDEVRFIFDRSMMLEMSADEANEKSSLVDELRISRIDYDEICELPLRIIKFAELD